jgi:hypothetical protein
VIKPRSGERAPGVAQLEPGSFRDPDSRVFYAGDGVLRVLSEQGRSDWEAFAASALFAEATAAGQIVGTEPAEGEAGLEGALERPAAAVLRHEVIPYVSYPYEWPFGMLKDAALLQLDLLRRALAEELILKDSSPYNIQWRGSQPVFIDIGSFERLRAGEPWAGYRQFCMLFLYPLMLRAYKSVSFRPWLRGSLDGITPRECAALMSLRDFFRRGVPTHVLLHARLDRRHEASERDIRAELRKAGFRKELIEANVRGLEKTVRRLEWDPPASVWTEYGKTTTYSEADADRKEEIVRSAVGARRLGRVWDLGANDGRYSRLAAQHADYVVATDADEAVVESLYQSLKQEGNRRILPLALDITDPSPGLGWRGAERKTLAERGTPDLTLCLALVHHVSISGNVPIADFLDWLYGLETALVIEFPTREDPMVRRLLARKRDDAHPDYQREWFEQCLAERFELEHAEELAGGGRVIYVARPRG